MATIFSAPTIGEPRAVGIKNGGIQQVETDIVRPMSRLSTDDDTWQAGKQMEFRWRSDSSRYWSPRDTRLYVKYMVAAVAMWTTSLSPPSRRPTPPRPRILLLYAASPVYRSTEVVRCQQAADS
jgi:hypothetical protein